MTTRLFLMAAMLLLLALSACTPQEGTMDEAALQQAVEEALAKRQAEQKDGIFVHISAGPEDPHRVLMPLQMAVMMSESYDVMAYFDIDAVKIVLKEADDLEYKQFPSSQTQLKALIEKGVPLYACPGCLEAAGYGPDDVMEGVQIAEKDKFFSFTEGRILTLDY